MKWISWAALLFTSSVFADALHFDARVEREEITVADTVELTVSIDCDGSQSFTGYRAPSLPDFDILHASVSEMPKWQQSGGGQRVRLTEDHHYFLRPKKRGTLVIGPASVRIGPHELHTRPLTVRVTASPKERAAVVATQDTPTLPLPTLLEHRDEDLFVDAQIDRSSTYVGQQIIVTWRLYTQGKLLKFRNLGEPKHEDFWNEDLLTTSGPVSWDRQVVNGHEYAVATVLKRALFPLKAGRLAIAPLSVEATTTQTAFYANASAVRKSNSLSVEVLSLPIVGRPAGFDPANVGAFEISSQVDREQVKLGEAVTWTIAVKGTGNLRGVKLPHLERTDQWKTDDPVVKEEIARSGEVKGEKRTLYFLTPQRTGVLTLPGIELHYFDPRAGRYATARADPISLQVESDPAALGLPNPPAPENVLERQIRPIRHRVEMKSELGKEIWRHPRQIVALFVCPPLLYGGLLIGDAIRRRLSKETAGTRRRRARRASRRRLRAAEHHIKAQRPGAFFSECARVLYEHLEFRLGQKFEGLTLEELRFHLLGRGFQSETAEAVVKELENCDFARFAPSASEPDEMRAALRRVSALIGWIERVKPSGEREAA
jgi:hypothetical protein